MRPLGVGRPSAALAVAGLVALCGLAACGDGPDPAASGPPPADFDGLVTEDVLAGDEQYRRRTLAEQQSAGVGLIRQTFDWSRIEVAPGRYELDLYDGYVAAVARRRIRLLPILFNPPAFRSSKPAQGARRGTYPPRRAADLGRLGAVLARRYGTRGTFWRDNPELPRIPIRSWQVWNEPSLPVYWASGPDPAEYVELLKATARGIRSADPKAEIVSAGLAESRQGTPFAEFTKGMYEAGAAEALDTFAIHPYAVDARAAIDAVATARRLIREAGDDAPVWITELGWATGGPPSPFTVTEPRQAELIRDALGALRRRREELGVRGVVYFCWKDSLPYAGGGDFFGLHTGLLRRNNRAKPGLAAFRSAAAR